MTETAEGKEKREKLRRKIEGSVSSWAGTCAWIENKEKQKVRFEPNILQLRMFAAHEWCRAHGKLSRQIALKIRQCGGTTAGAAISAHETQRWNSRTAMIADTFKRSDLLFKIYKRFLDSDDWDWGNNHTATAHDVTFTHGSEALKYSADSPKAGIGGTIQGLHKSEVAFWANTDVKNAYQVQQSLMPSLAKTPNSFEINESTPKGAFGLFCDLWADARWPEYDNYWQRPAWAQTNDPGEGNGLIRVFAAWWEMRENRLPVTEEQKQHIKATLSEREKRGCKLYNWTYNQIAWRRFMLESTDCMGNETFMDENYPEDPTSCWLSSGSPAFNQDGMAYLLNLAKARPFETVRLHDQGDAGVSHERCAADQCNFWIWEMPRVGFRYIISVDLMEGLDSNAGDAEGSSRDRHSVLVWRASKVDDDTRLFKAALVARVKPPCQVDMDLLVKWTVMLSRFYGDCIVAPERNSCGLAFIALIKKTQVPLYVQEIHDEQESRSTKKIGWHTNSSTKPQLVSNFQMLVRDHMVDIWDPHLVNEMQTFVRHADGTYSAGGSKKDDDVMSAGIGLLLQVHATEYKFARRPRTRPGRPYADDSEESKGGRMNW